MSGAVHPLPQYTFMAWYLAKWRDNFTFTFNTYNTYYSQLCLKLGLTNENPVLFPWDVRLFSGQNFITHFVIRYRLDPFRLKI
jgi:hypothetical protein